MLYQKQVTSFMSTPSWNLKKHHVVKWGAKGAHMALGLFRRTCCFILVYIHSISGQNEIAFCSFTAIQYKRFKKESNTRFTAVWNTKCEVIAIQEIFKAFILSFSFGTVPPKKVEQHREMMLNRTKNKNSPDGERDLCLAGSSGKKKKEP